MKHIALAFAAAILVVACSGDGGTGGSNGAEPSPTAPGGPPELPSGAQPTETASDLQIIDIVVGDGEKPEKGGVILVEYDAWLEDGTLFDTTKSLSGAYESPFGEGILIDGWEEGLAGMRVGGKRRLIVPPALAYGEDGLPPTIPGNETLTYDIELVGVRAPGEGG